MQSGKNKCLSKLPSRFVAKVGRELILQFSVENNTIHEEELFLLFEGFTSVNLLSNEKV